MLIAQFLSSYKKPAVDAGKSATTVFRFTVTGTESEMKEYKDIQGDNLRVDKETGKPLFFSTRFFGNRMKLIVTTNESTGEQRIIADDSELVKIQSLVDTFGADVAKLVLAGNSASAIGAE